MNKNVFYFIIFAGMVLFFGCTANNQNGLLISAEGLKVSEEGSADADIVSFTLTNHNNLSANCYAIITLKSELNENKTLIIPLGIYEQGESRKEKLEINMPYGKTKVLFSPMCTFLFGTETKGFSDTVKTALDSGNNTPCGELLYEEKRLCELFVETNLTQCNEGDRNLAGKIFCIAFLFRKPDICNYILEESSRCHCLAFVNSNASFCGLCKKNEEKDSCYLDLALNWKQKELCSEISGNSSAILCNAILSRDANACKTISGEGNFYLCIMNIASLTKNYSLCNMIEDENQGKQCIASARESSV